MSLKKIILAFILSFIFSSYSFAADPIEIQYIQKIDSSTYKIFGNNFGTSPYDLGIYCNGELLKNVTKSLSGETNLELKNFLKVSGELYIEKTIKFFDKDGKIQEKKEKSNTIKISGSDNIILNPNYSIEYIQGIEFLIIPYEKIIDNFNNFKLEDIQKKITLTINGIDFVLNKDSGGNYNPDLYYFGNKNIIIPMKGIKDIDNIIKLKIDGKYSNYILFTKQNIKFENPIDITFEDSSYTKLVKLKFNKPSEINTLKGIEIYLNGFLIPSNDITLLNNFLLVRFDLLKFTKEDKVISLYIKNVNTGDFSNKIILNMEKYIENKITKIELGDGKNTNFDLKIIGTPNAFVGDFYKLKININGIDFSKDGTKEFIRDGSGLILKDSYGNDKFEMKNKFDFIRQNDYIIGNFYYSQFKSGENVIYINNENSTRISNKTSFIKGDFSKINYNYLTGSELTSINSGSENVIFEKGQSIINKKIDFINKPEKDIILGKISFNNLKSNDLYNISFDISSDSSVNFLQELKIDKLNLKPTKDSQSKIVYKFNQILYGKQFVSGNLQIVLNDLFNIEKTIKLNIKNISIKKLNGENNFEEVFPNKNSYTFNLAYNYYYSSCFDGEKDYCGLNKMDDSFLDLNLDFGAEVNNNEVSNSQLSNSGISNSNSNNKINLAVPILTFKTTKYKIYNEKFSKLYDKYKGKISSSSQLSIFKLSINNIVKILKLVEDKKTTGTIAVKNIKNYVKKISAIILSINSVEENKSNINNNSQSSTNSNLGQTVIHEVPVVQTNSGTSQIVSSNYTSKVGNELYETIKSTVSQSLYQGKDFDISNPVLDGDVGTISIKFLVYGISESQQKDNNNGYDMTAKGISTLAINKLNQDLIGKKFTETNGKIYGLSLINQASIIADLKNEINTNKEGVLAQFGTVSNFTLVFKYE